MAIKPSLLKIELLRYKRKGLLNTLIGIVLLIIFLKGIYQIGKYYWPTEINNKIMMYFAPTCIIHTGISIILSFFYLLNYWGQNKLFQKQRINNNSKWHWNRPNWPELKIKTIKQLCKIHFFYFPVVVLLGAYNFKGSYQFPTFKQFLLELLFSFIIEDLLFYWSHRLLHQPFLYKHIHKIHHQYDTPFANTSQYAHPIEYILGNMIPSAMGFIILGQRCHLYSQLATVLIRMMNTFQNHSGIQFGWSPVRTLPFSTSPSLHNFHHSINIGAYGSFLYLWDHFMGTNQQFYKQVYKIQ